MRLASRTGHTCKPRRPDSTCPGPRLRRRTASSILGTPGPRGTGTHPAQADPAASAAMPRTRPDFVPHDPCLLRSSPDRDASDHSAVVVARLMAADEQLARLVERVG